MRNLQDIAIEVSDIFHNTKNREIDVSAEEAAFIDNQWNDFIIFLAEDLRNAVILIHGDVLNENRHYLLLTYPKNCNHF